MHVRYTNIFVSHAHHITSQVTRATAIKNDHNRTTLGLFTRAHTAQFKLLLAFDWSVETFNWLVTHLAGDIGDGKKFPRSQILFSSVAVMRPRANNPCNRNARIDSVKRPACKHARKQRVNAVCISDSFKLYD